MGEEMKSIVSALLVIVILSSTLVMTLNIRPVEASGTIYIRADGRIDPVTANITTVDNVTYTFTNNNFGSIVIERDGIIVNGAGLTLQGTGTYPSRGIDLSGRTNVTVQNTQVRNFTYCIYLSSSSNNTVSGNNVTGVTAMSQYGIYLSSTLNSTVTGNTATANAWGGIWLSASSNNTVEGNNATANTRSGIYLSSSSDSNTISGNTASNNGHRGIEVVSSSSNTVTGNIAAANTWDGIWLSASSNNTISGNNVTANSDSGIMLYSLSNSNTVSENTATANGINGIQLYDSSINMVNGNTATDNGEAGIELAFYSNDNTVSGNTLTANTHKGIQLSASSNNTISGNNVTANSYFGISLFSSSNNAVSGNTVTDSEGGIALDSSYNNTVDENTATNGGRGIELQHSSNDNTVSGNTVTANSLEGIRLESSANNTVSRNTVTNNLIDGIYLAYSSSDNTVSENTVTGSSRGICFYSSSNSTVFHNNFMNNTFQASVDNSTNTWDNGYPSGGNYWDDYSGIDLFSGPSQEEPGNDGIGDTSYVIAASNADNYPLMGTFGPSTPSGEDVTVFPADDVCVTYEIVASEGLTIVEKPGSGPAPPPGLAVEQYYVIETTTDYAGNITIRIICNMSMGARGDAPLQEGWQLLQCVMLAGDVDEDFDVDIFDIVRLAGHYLAVKPDPRYDPQCDVDRDGDIDIFDIVRAAGNYGQMWDPLTGWSNITTRVDEGSNSIFGVTQSLSIFGVTIHT